MRRAEDGVDITTRVAFAVLGVLFVVLAATGAWLAFGYRPGIDGPIRGLHRVAGLLAPPVALLPAAVAVVRRRPALVATGIVFAASMAAASFTGYLLPWHTLALTVVRANADYRGVFDAFGDTVRFVLVGDAEVSPATYQRWVVIHLLALPAVLLASAAVLVREFLLRR